MQEVLQVLHVVLVHEQHTVVPVVPESQRCEQAQGCDQRLRQRNNQFPINGEVVGTVNFRRLDNLERNTALHKVLRQNHLPNGEQHRHNQRQIVVLKAQITGTHQIPRNQTTVEQSREVEEEGEAVSPRKVFSVQNVTGHSRHQHGKDSTNNGSDNGVTIGKTDSFRIFQTGFVRFQRPFTRPERVTVAHNVRFRSEGVHNNQQKRKEAKHAPDENQHITQQFKCGQVRLENFILSLHAINSPFCKFRLEQSVIRLNDLNNLVNNQNCDEAQAGLIQTCSRRHTVVICLHQGTINESIQNVSSFQDNRVVTNQLIEQIP